VTRLGLRYVDVIKPRRGEEFGLYLQPSILGLKASDLGAQELLNQYACRASTAAGSMVLRMFQSTNGKFMPPDLASNEVVLGQTVDDGESAATLDIDHFSTQEFPFATADIESRFWELHQGTDRAFRCATTDEARRIWEQKP
jgi:uncharacterized protein (TIGR04255 family)